MKKFELGQTVMTAGINNAMAEDLSFAQTVLTNLNKYIHGDWGDLSDEDKKMNDDAINSGDDRILAAYESPQGKIYIITEWDRSVTTILFAEEY